MLKINPEKIGLLIGPGGKNIKRLVEESGCEIDIEDDGTVKIFSVSPDGMEIARREIEGMSAEIEIGKIYRGRVVTIKDFGAFVEVFPGQDGLVHVSELSNKRVNKPEDVIKLGDELWVKCIGVDDKGRVKLSRKAAMEERGEWIASAESSAPSAAPEGRSREERAPREDRPAREERAPRGDRPDRAERPPSDAPRAEGNGESRPPRGPRTERPPRPERGPRREGSPEDKAKAASVAEPGKIYRAKVVSIKEFGAFVEFHPGAEGLVHVSELANFRVKRVEDIVQVGDEITVKCLGVDEKGRVRLSRRAAMEEREQEPAEGPTEAGHSDHPDGPEENSGEPNHDHDHDHASGNEHESDSTGDHKDEPTA